MPFELSIVERDRRWTLVQSEMARRNLDCLIIQGSYAAFRDANTSLQHMTNVNDEGFLVFPIDAAPTLYTFENRLDPTWVADWRGGIPFFGKSIARRLVGQGLGSDRLGLVNSSGLRGEYGGFPHATYASLREHLPSATIEEATDIVEGVRQIKSHEEIRCLEIACAGARKAIEAVIRTARVGVEDIDVRAEVTDTPFRNDCDQGSMVLYCQGKGILHGGQSGGFVGPAKRTLLEEGDISLIELDATYRGYEAQYNLAFAIREPDERWRRLFECGARAFRSGLAALRAGITLQKLKQALVQPIKDAGFTFANPVFHGLDLSLELPMGTCPRVGRYPDLSELVDAGMVLEFEPHPVTENGKRGVGIGCPILLTEDGCRPLDAPYSPGTPVLS